MTYEEAISILKPIYSDAEGRCHEAWVIVEAEVERLRAVVDKLPKTADGVPIHHNMKLYFRHPELAETWDWRVSLRPSKKEFRSTQDEDDFYLLEVSDCYSTREAAEEARENP